MSNVNEAMANLKQGLGKSLMFLAVGAIIGLSVGFFAQNSAPEVEATQIDRMNQSEVAVLLADDVSSSTRFDVNESAINFSESNYDDLYNITVSLPRNDVGVFTTVDGEYVMTSYKKLSQGGSGE